MIAVDKHSFSGGKRERRNSDIVITNTKEKLNPYAIESHERKETRRMKNQGKNDETILNICPLD